MVGPGPATLGALNRTGRDLVALSYRQPERSSDPTRIEKTLGRRELVITGCIGQPLLLSPSHSQVRHLSSFLVLPGWSSGVRQEVECGIPGKDSPAPAMQVSSNDPLYF